jgi:hypothetical protein
MIKKEFRRQPGVKYRVLTTEPEYKKILTDGMVYVRELKRSAGIAAPVIRDKVVTTKITGIKRKGRRVSFKAKNGKTHTVRVSRRRTTVTLNGKKFARDKLKVGMTCEFNYPGNKKRAKSIACK